MRKQQIMKKICSVLLLLTASTAFQLQAEDRGEGLKVSANIGNKQFVLLSKTSILSSISSGHADTLVGTAGTDEKYLGQIEVNVYSNNATVSNSSDNLEMYQYEYDVTNANFSLLHQLNGSDRLYLDIRSNMNTTGTVQNPTSIGVTNPALLRENFASSNVTDEIFQLSFWVLDDVNNATTSGRYIGTFVFFFVD